MDAQVFPDFKNPDGVGMVDFRHRAGFAVEPLDEVFLAGELLGQHFERRRAVQADLVGEIDFAHAALAELFEDLVIADLRDGFSAFGLRSWRRVFWK
jgi:hypothetical protein